MKNFRDSLGIIIPIYNEELIVGKCIEKVIQEIKKLKINTKLIVVNDGSTDNTSKILNTKKKLYKKYLTILTHKRNRGYGKATQTGIEEAVKKRYIWCLHMDSDLTNDPKYIKSFVRSISSNYDCIKASRYINGGKVKNVSFFRQTISTIGNYIASLLFGVGIKDCTNGFRMVRLEAVKKIHFKEENFSIILEELYYLKKQGAQFKEIPYILTARKSSESHFKYNIDIFIDYFTYAIKAFLL